MTSACPGTGRGEGRRVLSLPPDDTFRAKVGEKEVRAYFESVESSGASLYSARAPHPYMQKTATLDLCIVIEGEVTLVLDTTEVRLEAGDTVVHRGTNHAWSNEGNEACLLAISSHDARR